MNEVMSKILDIFKQMACILAEIVFVTTGVVIVCMLVIPYSLYLSVEKNAVHFLLLLSALGMTGAALVSKVTNPKKEVRL